MTDHTPNIAPNIPGLLQREWRELEAGIRQIKMEELFMQVTAAATQQSYELTDAERADALALHDQTDRDFLAAIEGLSPAQWTFKPGANRWSIQEVAEHVILATAWIGDNVTKMMAQDPDPSAQEKPGVWEAVRVRVLDRSVRGIQSPSMMVPSGQWSLEETVRRFADASAVTRELITRPELPLKGRSMTGPPGTYTCDHWLTLISLHTRRHLAQIVEIKTTQAGSGFPQ